MPEEKESFDLDKMAVEIAEMQPDEPQAEEMSEAASDDEAQVEEVAAEEVAEPATAEADDDDHEKFARSFNGKAIPQEAFLKRLAREKKKRDELSSQYATSKAENEGLRKAQPLKQEDVEKFQRLEGVFGNLDKAAREMPWLTPLLLAVGAGKKPDWESVRKGMEDYLASVPKGDPILYQQLQELKEQQQELVQERVNNQALTHIQSEDVEIAKIFGEKSDPVAQNFWAELNRMALHEFRATGPKSFAEAPDRVGMAKRLFAAAQAYHQRQLKAQLPSANKPKASLQAGVSSPGAIPTDKSKIPTDIHSPEFAAYLLNG